ncbi:septal ring lytic transglycosylase RlpA family protein [Lysinibacillus sp. NPDC095746]|uniref:septal ring lytic transglycosylase RlpA family protein n=1 Tax=Lysinibacillus sp. NPDC095746 TaxID=3364134 RepID=UPI0038055B74
MAGYNGIASWNRTTNKGMCGTWDNNKNVAAYPHVYQMNSGTCDLTGCNKPLVRLNCGSQLLVSQPCSNKSVNVNIADCGPAMSSYCSDTGVYCKQNYFQGRLIDLSPTAFAALGDLDHGTMTVRVEYS